MCSSWSSITFAFFFFHSCQFISSVFAVGLCVLAKIDDGAADVGDNVGDVLPWNGQRRLRCSLEESTPRQGVHGTQGYCH